MGEHVIVRPVRYQEHSLLGNTRELVDTVVTKEGRRAFVADGKSATDLEHFAKTIEMKCMHQMADSSVQAQNGMNTKKQGTYLVVRRVRLYRNELITLTGDSEPPLQDRPPAPAAATPASAGHRSIASFFRRNNA
jgi:hypothetical protein